MTGAVSVSLVIVSHSRPDSLARLLKSLRHQTLRCFQTIVVTDASARVVGKAEHVPFEQRNISAARNAGIVRAMGNVVAFCDDDAVPEPAWLERLTAPFSNPLVGATGGFVRNRNGIAFQSKAVTVDMCGRDRQVSVNSTEQWSCPTPPKGQVFKTIGTNCAFRLAALREVGGFDTAMRYYLEDADLNIRLAANGWLTAVVPSAEVHHGLHAGPHRTSRGAPADLFEVGASLAYFLQKHCKPDMVEHVLAEFRVQREARLRKLRSRVLLSKRGAQNLLQGLERGFVEGHGRSRVECPEADLRLDLGHSSITTRPASKRIALLARPFRRRVSRHLAMRLTAEGHDVTLIDFRPGLRFLTVRYQQAGYWLHRGGCFGLGVRSGPLFRFASVRQRCDEEMRRLSSQRAFEAVHEVTAWTIRGGLISMQLETGDDKTLPFTRGQGDIFPAQNPTLR